MIETRNMYRERSYTEYLRSACLRSVFAAVTVPAAMVLFVALLALE
jgi:hypothetical protein